MRFKFAAIAVFLSTLFYFLPIAQLQTVFFTALTANKPEAKVDIRWQVWEHRSNPLDRFPTKTPYIYTLCGNRQIGKSTIA